MKRITLLALVIIMAISTYAQVAVNDDGSAPNAAAMLDVQATDQGMLVPRLALISTSDPISTTKPDGLLVYNTSTTGTYSTPGFYYWNGSDWQLIGQSSGTPAEISDADNNTRVTTEENPDENIVRTFIDGTERMNFDGSTLQILNGGTTLSIGEDAGTAGAGILGNTFIGYESGKLNTGGDDNTFVGSASGLQSSTGYDNTYIGMSSGKNNTAGDRNAYLGFCSGFNNPGSDNVYLGSHAGYFSTGSQNVFIGRNAGYNYYGTGNIIIGYQAGYVGNSSNKLIIDNSSADSLNALIYGDFAVDDLWLNGTVRVNKGSNSLQLPTTRGFSGQFLTSAGNGATYWTSLSGGTVGGSGVANRVAFWTDANTLSSNDDLYWDDFNDRLGVGTTTPDQTLDVAGNVKIPVTTTYQGVVYMESSTFIHNKNGNAFFGLGAGNLTTTGSESVGIGGAALTDLTSGYKNTAVGYMSLKDNTAGHDNTSIGGRAMEYNITGNENVAIGPYTNYLNQSGSSNICIGFYSGFNNTSSNNIFIGTRSGHGNNSGKSNIYIGYRAGHSSSSASSVIAIGDSAAYSNTGSEVIAIGRKAGYWNGLGENNTYIGIEAGYGGTPVNNDNNTFLGFKSGHNHRRERSNVYIGSYSGYTGEWNKDNVFIGDSSGFTHNLGYENVFVGSKSGLLDNSGQYNTFVGFMSGYGNNNGQSNTFVGYKTGKANTGGSSNTFVGSYAGQVNTSGQDNVFIGQFAGNSNTTGTGNIYIGYNAAKDWATSNKLFIGYRGGYDHPLIYGDIWYNRVVIAGDSSDNTSNLTFHVQGSAGGIGTWINTSDKNLKKDIHTIDHALQKVMSIEGVRYSWIDKEKFDKREHIGFLAQDVQQFIPEVVHENDGHYSMEYAPLTAVLVEAIKEQQLLIEEQGKRIEALEKRLGLEP